MGVLRGDQVDSLQGATSSTNGFQGLAPTPVAGEQNNALFGDGTYRPVSEGVVGEIQEILQEKPGFYFAGATLFNYPSAGSPTVNQIQYTRISLNAGITLTAAEIYVASSPTGNVQIGLYSQADPLDQSGTPLNQVAVTPLFSSAVSEAFVETNFIASYNVTVSGLYWIAFIGGFITPRFAMTSNVYRANFLPVYRQNLFTTALPATTSSLIREEQPVIYVAVKE